MVLMTPIELRLSSKSVVGDMKTRAKNGTHGVSPPLQKLRIDLQRQSRECDEDTIFMPLKREMRTLDDNTKS